MYIVHIKTYISYLFYIRHCCPDEIIGNVFCKNERMNRAGIFLTENTCVDLPGILPNPDVYYDNRRLMTGYLPAECRSLLLLFL